MKGKKNTIFIDQPALHRSEDTIWSGFLVISVLFVDNEPPILEMTKIALERTGKFSVDVAQSASLALEKLKHASYDAIVSDYQMPGMDGIELLKTLRASGNDIPFIIFTGKGREEVVIQAYEHGADFYVQKAGDPKIQFSDLEQKITRSVGLHRAERDRLESEDRLRQIIQFMPDATFAIDMEGKVIAWNKAIEDMTGIPESQMVGKGEYAYAIPFYGERRPLLIDLALKPDAEIAQKYTDFRKEGRFLTAESLGIKLKGRDAVLWGKATALYDTHCRQTGAIESIRDITEYKKTQITLRESEERYRRLADNAQDLIYRYEFIPKRGFTYVSPSATKITGYSPEEHYADPDLGFKIVHEEDRDLLKSITEKVVGEIPPLEFRWLRKDGTIIWTEQVNIPIFDNKGNLVAIEGIARDITRRKAIEQELLNERKRLFDVLEALPVMICLLTPDYLVRFANRSFREKFGEAQERHCYELCFGQNEPCSFCEVHNVLETGKPHEWEFRLNDGTYTHVYHFPFTDPDGSPIILEMIVDITDQILKEQEIRSLNSVLEQRVEERTAQLTKALNDREVLLREVHHRVKNNLQIIFSLLNLQARYITDEKTISAIRESQNRIKAMALVHERMYRSEEISRISFKDYIKFLVSHLFGFYGVHNRQVSSLISMEDFPIEIDMAIPLGLIMTELVSNSLKYAFPDGRKGVISIAGSCENTHTFRFVVKDNGIGIPGDLDWKNPDTLGLRLVNSLVTQLNGMIELDRTGGTMFTIIVHSKRNNR